MAAGAENWKTAPPLKSTLKSRPAGEQGHDADEQDGPGDRVPPALAADEVVGDLAAVEPAADLAEPRHHASPELRDTVLRGAAPGPRLTWVRRTEDRHGVRAPSRAGSRPDSGWPSP